MAFNNKLNFEEFNNFGKTHLPELLGIVITELRENYIAAEMPVHKHHFAPNGYIHAGAVVSLADTTAGYGCIAHLPDKGTSFTTLELKSNFLSSAREGTITCEATPSHLGRTTHVWDVSVKHKETGKTLALFRCTQLIIY